MPTIELSIGPVEYRVFGPDTAGAPTAVFVHGFLVNGTLWDPVAERLAVHGVRSIVPDWPLGSHRTPVRRDATLTPASVGDAVLDLVAALGLDDVTLVGNDTGGAICQLVLRRDNTRIGSLVLTNCDVFENFPPKFFVPLFTLAKHPAAVWALLQTMRPFVARHSPVAYGMLLRRPRSKQLTSEWVRPALSNAAIRSDITRFARGLQRHELVDAEAWLTRFDRPVRIVWGTRDRNFTLATARRLRDAFPNAVLTEVPDATTFVPIDAPDAVAIAIIAVRGEPVADA
jgi:pimeloyl-ACP methyl ester carboxylesterase